MLSDDQKKRARELFRDPASFAASVLGVDLWSKQVEILNSIASRRRTAVKACHSVGKTFLLAVATLWWLIRYEEGIVLTTSPTERQVRAQLWSEIRNLVRRSKIPFPKVKMTELKLRGDNNFAIGFSTNQTENFQGFHGRDVLIIADEAPGIESGIWDAIAGTMAGGNVHVVMSGNPTVPSGAFYDAFFRERATWTRFTISAFDSPNLAGISLEDLLNLNPIEGGPLDQNAIPYLVTKRWVHDQYRSWWHGSESASPQWLSRVLAEFPDQAQNALISISSLERAKLAAESNPTLDPRGPLVAGVDVGGGAAETVVYVCSAFPGRSKVVDFGAWRGEDTRGHVVRFLNQYRRRLIEVRVDSIGIGHNFGLHLRDQHFNVEMVNVAQPPEGQENLRESDPASRFVNRKAQFYQHLADLLESGQLEGPTDDETIGQLSSLLYEIDARGRMKIESKEDARRRGAPSPDRAEALMLALGESTTSKLPISMKCDLAGIYHEEGLQIQDIAIKLSSPIDHVRDWISECRRREIEHRGLADRPCDHCHELIEFGKPVTRQGDQHYHEYCASKAIFGVS